MGLLGSTIGDNASQSDILSAWIVRRRGAEKQQQFHGCTDLSSIDALHY